MRRMMVCFMAFVLVIGAAACDGDDDDTSSTSEAPRTTVSTNTTNTTTVPADGMAVRVYFVWNEKVGTAGRAVDAAAGQRGAVEALLGGPDDFETSIGMSTQIPDATLLLGLAIANGVATVDLSNEFQSGGGSLSMLLRTAELVFTLTQFADVESVNVTLDGAAVDAIGGEGIPATDLDRTDFANVTPMILIESPVPGQDVTSPLSVSGIANVFEANVNYSVNDPEGLVLADGFTTADATTGAWGPFGFTVDYTTERSGLGSVIAWETSAEDGSQQNVYEVPVSMGE